MRFSTDDYWEGNDYDCPDDLPDYLRDEAREPFHTDDCCGDDTDDYYNGFYF